MTNKKQLIKLSWFEIDLLLLHLNVDIDYSLYYKEKEVVGDKKEILRRRLKDIGLKAWEDLPND